MSCEVYKVVYLGVCLTSQIQGRIQTGNGDFFSILPLMKRCDTSWKVKVVYGSQTWTVY